MTIVYLHDLVCMTGAQEEYSLGPTRSVGERKCASLYGFQPKAVPNAKVEVYEAAVRTDPSGHRQYSATTGPTARLKAGFLPLEQPQRLSIHVVQGLPRPQPFSVEVDQVAGANQTRQARL